MAKRTERRFDAERWLESHLEDLVDRFPGEYVLVADGKVYRGDRPSRLRDEARAANPRVRVLFGLRVPRPEDFLCALPER